MKLISLALFIFLGFSDNLYSQNARPEFVEQKNQNCLEFEAFPSFSYSYARKFNPKLILGFRIQVGFGLRFLLTNPMGHYGCDQCLKPGWIHARVQYYGSAFFDYLKVESFYRVRSSKHTFIDAGLFASNGSQGEGVGGGLFTGLEGAAFYTFSAFHLGTKLMVGCRFYNLDTKAKFDYVGLFIVPLIIGINF
jgi:hypothetical protein